MKKILLIGLSLIFSWCCPSEDEDMVERKTAWCEKLVQDAFTYFNNPTISIGAACHEFSTNPRWRHGEIKIFIFGELGECFLADPLTKIWRDFYDEKNSLSDSFIKDMLSTGVKGGWVAYPWNNDTQHAYVRVVSKLGKNYIIGAGFYPESAKHRAEQMVNSAIRYLNKYGSKDLFSRINNPFGAFVRGDIYLWVYDPEGNVLAHGNNIALVGQNIIDWQDKEGKFLTREIIRSSQANPEASWVDHMEHGLLKREYVRSIVDPQTRKTYIIGGGYYPTLDDETVKNFVKRALNYLKINGKKVAFAEFSNQAGDFVPGPLRLFVYDLEGTMLADSENPGFVGQNLRNAKDAEGKFITQRIVDQAKNQGHGWVSFLDKNAYKDTYVEKIVVPDGDFIIGAGYWPTSKQRAVKSMVDKATTYALSHPIEQSLDLFTSGDSDFLRGDIYVNVFDQEDFCLAQGLNPCHLWMKGIDVFSIRNQEGRAIYENIRDTARAGGGWVDFAINNARCHVFSREIEIVHKKLSPQEIIAEHTATIVKSKNLVVSQEPVNLESSRYIVASFYYR